MNIPQTFKEMMYYSLSNEDITKLCPKSNIITYTDLNECEHIDDIFENSEDDSCFLLYLTQKTYGHWCVLFKRSENEIDYFNSYGTKPDIDLTKIPKDSLYEYGQSEPILYELLAKSGYKVEYNNSKLQKRTKGISTCGCHCVTRLYNREKTSDEYIKCIKSYKDIGDPDYMVSIVCGSKLFNIV